MPLRLKFVLVLTLVAVGSIALSACGGDKKESSASPTTPAAAATTRPTSAPSATTAANPTTAPSATSAPNPTSAPPAPTAVSANPTAASGGAANSITIADFSYSPARFNARAGETIRLTVTNGGNLPHTFTIDGVVDSGTIASGSSKIVQFTPTQAGTLIYYCTIHGRATMSGQITVAGTSGALPPDNPGGGQATSGSSNTDTGNSDSQSSPPAGYEYGY